MFFVDPYFSKSIGGARFFASITNHLRNYPEYSEKKFKYVLINLSTPIYRFIFYKFLFKKIIIRVDGNYSYPITRSSLKASNKILYSTVKIFYKIFFFKKILRKLAKNEKILFIFNLRFNYANYLRILISDTIIFQSAFSQKSHTNIFANKKFYIIRNSSTWKLDDLPFKKYKEFYKKKESILICTSFHKDRPLKGFGDLLLDLKKIKNEFLDLNLFIYGYVPECFIKTYSGKIINFDEFKKTNSWISTYPKFQDYSEDLSKKLISADIYLTYAQLDPCPNMVIEAIAHGLPVIGCDSGGVPEIVGNCGEIIPLQKKNQSNFQNLNFDYGLRPPKTEDLYKSILKILKNKNYYQRNINLSLQSNLSIENAVDSYHKILNNISFLNK